MAQPVFVRNFQNYIADFSIDRILHSDQRTAYHVGFSYVMAGYNQGDYKIDVLQRFKTKPITYTLQAMMEKYHPDYFYQRYKSNQFIWENAFQSIIHNSLQIGLKSNGWRNNLNLLFKVQTFDNYVYLDASAMPVQATSSAISYTSKNHTLYLYTVEINKTFQLWKFKFEHLLYFQQTNSNYLRIPELAGIARYYFQSKFFGFGKFQLGVNMTYQSAYYGNAYNPSLRQFYLQDEVKIGNYPVISPFFVGDLNRASLFFMYEHLNQDWYNKGFYGAAHYPIPLQAIRMGVRWRLYE